MLIGTPEGKAAAEMTDAVRTPAPLPPSHLRRRWPPRAQAQITPVDYARGCKVGDWEAVVAMLEAL
jgi:hypothetical protein